MLNCGLSIGLALPTTAQLTAPTALERLARAAEDLGFAGLWTHDHVLPPAGAPDMAHQLDSLSVLAWLAAHTHRLTIGTSILVLPYRQAPEVAKTLASIDWLSSGRVIAGIGAGWLEDEFAALGVPFGERGAITDEAMRVIRALWSDAPASFAGRRWSFADVVSRPAGAPNRRCAIPLIVGGNSAAAMRRAARMGDGWHPLNLPVGDLAGHIVAYRRACADAGRTPGVVIARHFPAGVARPIQGRLPFTGNAAQIARDVERYSRTGADGLVLSWDDSSVDGTLRRWERFSVAIGG